MESFLQNRPALATASRYTLQPALEPGFQPFLRPTSPNDKGTSGPSTDTPLDAQEDQPQVELVNRDGCVERIIITCSCCKRIELECEY